MPAREFSEGEWESEFDGDGYLINGIIRVPRTYEEYPADAKLIAAAPNLYRACEAALAKLDYLRNLWGDEGVTRSVADQLRAAVNKATLSEEEAATNAQR